MKTVTGLEQVYTSIEFLKESYGRLHKCEFHIHTPASHDYRLTSYSLFKEMTLDDVLKVAEDEEYLTSEYILELKQKTSEENESLVKELNEKSGTTYRNFKELLGYELIANKLYRSEIEIAVISDHNTIKGYKNLREAIIRLYDSRYFTKRKFVRLFLGIEISCSDRYHLIGIFNEDDYTNVQQFVDKFIHSEEEGTYISCLDMVKKVRDHSGIPYIAHINSNQMLGTELYKRSLFGADDLFIVGLTNSDSNEKTIKRIEQFCPNARIKFCCINEGDSHELSQIGVRNSWIKFNTINFQSLKKAFSDHKICVYRDKPIYNDRFIKGIYIIPGEEGGFLTGKEDPKSPFIVDFSRDLNCIIGGRGVGKSTILDILETVFTLEIKDKNKLKFISRNKIIYVVFYYKGDDYVLQFIPQVGSTGYTESFFLEKAFKEGVVTDKGFSLAPHWVELFKVTKGEKKELVFTKVEQEKTIKLLSEVYKKSFSINNIIEQINSGKVSDFIREIILNGSKFNSINRYISTLQQCNKNNYRKTLRIELKNIVDDLAERNRQVYTVIKEFNELNTRLIQVTSSPKSLDPAEYINVLSINGKSHVANTYLTWDDVEKYIYTIVKKMNFLQFIELLINKKHDVLEEVENIEKFISSRTIGGYEEINKQNLKKVYNSIESKLFNNTENVTASLFKFLNLQDDYTLLFNINSKESIQSTSVQMREVETLSLGQKVVAILTFLFNFGEQSLDSTPLVIDQPEDNLDNQYIYKNLVESLKKVKNSRQVIISTHSSTIVTNADAEQVIILESNNTNGWLVKKGYPGDRVIIRHILTILEGGEQSFNHKAKTYSNVLNLV
ncbi:AAA family ATPase [Bacillus sp. ISL-35]|uniref:Spaf_1101 family AAA-like ATPase n=1 Tax=Bacillus sp. ISL-35 TaxID=2819122 RepID=UPI001BE68846|nr:AAA family ATPase [Bacillus sp. ISL-35]MBT2681805.1 AAA family ATPase [Bacillus sp. ISL-35]MBT2701953.1 AAA family ATPase [Chryseobacterium sp. ISL-80]